MLQDNSKIVFRISVEDSNLISKDFISIEKAKIFLFKQNSYYNSLQKTISINCYSANRELISKTPYQYNMSYFYMCKDNQVYCEDYYVEMVCDGNTDKEYLVDRNLISPDLSDCNIEKIIEKILCENLQQPDWLMFSQFIEG